MPELPEVEIMARNAARWAQGASIRRVDVPDPAVLAAGLEIERLRQALRDAPVTAVHRRGKYMVLEAGPQAMLWHFRMTGKVVRDRRDRPARIGLGLDNTQWLWLVDRRRLAHVELVAASRWREVLDARGLGDEPWPERRDGAWWAARLGSATGSLKGALMAQRRVAGLGNIAASEICWESGLHPASDPRALRAEDWERLARAAHGFIDRVIREESGDEIRFVSEGNQGADGTPFRVYRRSGLECPRCGDIVQRAAEAGRATFWCGGCQFHRMGCGDR